MKLETVDFIVGFIIMLASVPVMAFHYYWAYPIVFISGMLLASGVIRDFYNKRCFPAKDTRGEK